MPYDSTLHDLRDTATDKLGPDLSQYRVSVIATLLDCDIETARALKYGTVETETEDTEVIDHDIRDEHGQ